MKTDEYRRMRELCEEIGTEKDPQKFLQLVEDLNQLLEEGKLLQQENPAVSAA